MYPGTGFFPLPLPVREGREVATEVGDEISWKEFYWIGISGPSWESQLKGEALTFLSRPKALLLGHLPLSPCGGGS